MRQAFAHDAAVRLAPGGDERALGAAITVALCGHWEHEPPCPLAPHHTSVSRVGDDLRLRVLFAVEPEREELARGRIDAALAGGHLEGPDDLVTTWELHTSARGEVQAQEFDHAERLKRS